MIRNTVQDRNAEILVQGDQPVLVRGLVEQRALDSNRRKEWCHDDMGFERYGQFLAALQIKQIPGADSATAGLAECCGQLGALARR